MNTVDDVNHFVEAAQDVAAQTWQSALDALRAQGAQRIDPVRFTFIEAMAQRLPAASALVQPILERKLRTALAALGARVQQAHTPAGDAQVPNPRALAKAASSPVSTPLAELNRYIQQATQHEAVPVATSRPTRPARELKSVRRFRETWSKIAALQQVDRALVRAPENAGPLNSHMLVLHSLALMRSLSPDYLQRFMSHVDTLLWIDQANQKPALAEAKPAAKRSRAKK